MGIYSFSSVYRIQSRFTNNCDFRVEPLLQLDANLIEINGSDQFN